MKVTKEYVFEPSAFDLPDQDQYKYWLYTFNLSERTYSARRYTDQPERATILDTIRGSDAVAQADARAIARYLMDVERVERVDAYNTHSGSFDWRIDP